MKVEIDILNADAIVIAALRQSAKNILAVDPDRKYTRKYIKAVSRVLEHFGAYDDPWETEPE